MTSPTSTRNTTSAMSARSVIWPPQEAPIRLYATWSGGMPDLLAIAARTFGTSSVGSSVRVCTLTWLLPMVLTVASSSSGTPELRSASRIESTVWAVTLVVAWKSAPPLNSIPKSRPRPCQRDDGNADQDGRDDVPATTVADEVVGDLTGVETVSDRAQLGHQASLRCSRPLDGATAAGRTASGVAPGSALTPRCSGSSPDHLWPPPKNLVRASSVISGLVNKNTTTHVDQRGQAEGEREALDRADGQDEQDHRRRASRPRRRSGSCAGPAASRSRPRSAGSGPRAPRPGSVRRR